MLKQGDKSKLQDNPTIEQLKEWLKSKGIKSDHFLSMLMEEEKANPKNFNQKFSDLTMLMRKSLIQDKCQQMTLQTLESQMLSVESNIADNPLKDIVEINQLSKTGHRDLIDLMDICLDNGMSPGHDLQYQFESLANKISYEKEYLELKARKMKQKLENQVDPQIQSKRKLRDVLDSLYDGQLKHEQKEMLQVAQKMNKDSTDKEVKIQEAAVDVEEKHNQVLESNKQGVSMDVLEKLSHQVRDLESEVTKIKETIDHEYADLPTDVAQAKLKLAQLRDEVKLKEETLKKKLAS